MMCSNSHFALVFINGLGNTYEDAYHSGEELAARLGVGVNNVAALRDCNFGLAFPGFVCPIRGCSSAWAIM